MGQFVATVACTRFCILNATSEMTEPWLQLATIYQQLSFDVTLNAENVKNQNGSKL